jgi:hypothetical protein
MKRETTKKGAPQSRAEAEQIWAKTWKELTQERIQQWIRRIELHIKEVIKLEGGNEYKEGTGESKERRRRRRPQAYSASVSVRLYQIRRGITWGFVRA